MELILLLNTIFSADRGTNEPRNVISNNVTLFLMTKNSLIKVESIALLTCYNNLFSALKQFKTGFTVSFIGRLILI